MALRIGARIVGQIEHRKRGYGGHRTLMVALVQSEARLEHDLVIAHRTIFDAASCLNDFKPSQISERSICPVDRSLNRVLDTVLGRPDQLDDLINVFSHRTSRRLPVLVSPFLILQKRG